MGKGKADMMETGEKDAKKGKKGPGDGGSWYGGKEKSLMAKMGKLAPGDVMAVSHDGGGAQGGATA